MKRKLIIVLKKQNIEIDEIIKKYKLMKEKNIKAIRKMEEEIIKEKDKRCYH